MRTTAATEYRATMRNTETTEYRATGNSKTTEYRATGKTQKRPNTEPQCEPQKRFSIIFVKSPLNPPHRKWPHGGGMEREEKEDEEDEESECEFTYVFACRCFDRQCYMHRCTSGSTPTATNEFGAFYRSRSG